MDKLFDVYDAFPRQLNLKKILKFLCVSTYLVNIVAALCDEGVVVGEEVGPLQHSVQLQLGLIAGLRGDSDWKKIIEVHGLGLFHV